MSYSDIVVLVIAIAIPQIAGGIGAIFTARNIPAWYDTLQKPWLAPPNWIFGPVWTTLYLLMGVASYLVWQQGWYHPAVKFALIMYAIQLILNTLWSFFFFGMRNPRLAFYEINVLWIAIEITSYAFYPISHRAMYLMIPYSLWTTFAYYLNLSYWKLNRAYGKVS